MGHLLLEPAARIKLRMGALLEVTDHQASVRLGSLCVKFPGRFSKELGSLKNDGDLPVEFASSPAIAALRSAMLLDSVIGLGVDGNIRIQPIAPCFNPKQGPAPKDVWPSRFAFASFEDGAVIIEQPHAGVRVRVYGAAVAKAAALLSRQPGSDDRTALTILNELYRCHILVDPNEEDGCVWEPHDLLMHSHSRLGRTDAAYGGTWRLRGRIPVPPALVPATRETIPLPAAQTPRPADFLDVLDGRESTREFGDVPITLAELSSLFHHGARVRSVSSDGEWQTTGRPYPSGGRAYELEIYAAVHQCEGLHEGLYRYLPDSHALELRSGQLPHVHRLLDEAAACYHGRSHPQVLLIFTARIARVAYKYESIAYSLVLKHVGVLQQTLCLVSAALGIGACVLGGGNSEHFAQAAGVDPLEECSIGEMIVGSSNSQKKEIK